MTEPTAPADTHQLLEVALGRRSPGAIKDVSLRGLEALVAYRRSERGESLSKTERRALAVNATTWTLLEETLEEVSGQLEKAHVSFVLLKGAAIAHLYPLPYLRATSDLDLLVNIEDLARARDQLCTRGWQSAVTGRFAENYLQQEGSCWQGYRSGRVVLELHFRFWGSVACTYQDAVFSTASTHIELGLAPNPVHQLIIAASHAWRQPTPRRATDLLDVCLLLQDAHSKDFEDLLHEAHNSGQTLPVCLALDVAGAVLNEPWILLLLDQIEAALRRPERRILALVRTQGQDRISWSKVRLAMLLARRESRAGWKSVTRQAWPHRGILEQQASDYRSWPAQRIAHLYRTARSLGGKR